MYSPRILSATSSSRLQRDDQNDKPVLPISNDVQQIDVDRRTLSSTYATRHPFPLDPHPFSMAMQNPHQQTASYVSEGPQLQPPTMSYAHAASSPRYTGCFYCGETNHKHIHCRFGEKIRCYLCNETGHKRKFCKNTYTC